MIQYKSLTQYSRVVDGIRFQQNPKKPFLLVYFSENSSFADDYPKLNIIKMDAKYVVVPITRIPLTRLTSDNKKSYKKYGLLSFSSNMAIPKNKNLIIDTTVYTNKLDEKYKPNNYKQRAGTLMMSNLQSAFSIGEGDYQKILIYSININKPFNTFMNRKSFALLKSLHSGNLFFDDLLLATISDGVKYRSLIKDRNFKFPRVFQYFRMIKAAGEKEGEELSDSVFANQERYMIDPITKYILENYK